MCKRLLLNNVIREMVRDVTDLFPSSQMERFSLCHPDETLLKASNRPCSPQTRQASEHIVTASRRLTQEIVHLFKPVYLDRDCKCAVTRTVNLFKEVLLIQAEKERHLFSAQRRETPVRPCTLQVLSLDGRRDRELVV